MEYLTISIWPYNWVFWGMGVLFEANRKNLTIVEVFLPVARIGPRVITVCVLYAIDWPLFGNYIRKKV